MANDNDIRDVTAAMGQYFDGLYHADTERLGKVFHPDCIYVNMTDGDYMHLSLETYFDAVRQRTPPASLNEPRKDRIVSITFGGKNMVFVQATLSMMGRDYHDFLTFTRDEMGWRIMSKVFEYTLQE